MDTDAPGDVQRGTDSFSPKHRTPRPFTHDATGLKSDTIG